MSGKKVIKEMMNQRGLNIKDMAEKLDIKEQSMRNKLTRDSFSFKEVQSIAEMLDFDITIDDKNWSDTSEGIAKKLDVPVKFVDDMKLLRKENKDLYDQVVSGTITVEQAISKHTQ